jgi:hypothetical protein
MNPSSVLGLGSRVTGPAIGAELVWYLETVKTAQPQQVQSLSTEQGVWANLHFASCAKH